MLLAHGVIYPRFSSDSTTTRVLNGGDHDDGRCWSITQSSLALLLLVTKESRLCSKERGKLRESSTIYTRVVVFFGVPSNKTKAIKGRENATHSSGNFFGSPPLSLYPKKRLVSLWLLVGLHSLDSLLDIHRSCNVIKSIALTAHTYSVINQERSRYAKEDARHDIRQFHYHQALARWRRDQVSAIIYLLVLSTYKKWKSLVRVYITLREKMMGTYQ